MTFTDPVIRLSFGSGAIPVIGAITSRAYADAQSWMPGVLSLVLGHDRISGQDLLRQPPGVPSPVTVVFDRYAEPKAANPSEYAYGWWIEPAVTSTPTFTALSLVWDTMQGELALHRFPAGTTIPGRPKPADLDPYKLHAYDYRSINSTVEKLFPGNFRARAVFPDLTALLLNTAVTEGPVGDSRDQLGWPRIP